MGTPAAWLDRQAAGAFYKNRLQALWMKQIDKGVIYALQ